MRGSTANLLKTALAELNEAYDRINTEINELDVVQDLIGDSMCRVKALLMEVEKNERLVSTPASKKGN